MLKERVHPKMKILSIYSHSVPNMYKFHFSVENKRRYFLKNGGKPDY